MGLYLPQRWKRQPQGPQRINWGNPLAAGLEHAVIHNGSRVDSVTSSGASSINTAYASRAGLIALTAGYETYPTRQAAGSAVTGSAGLTQTLFALCVRTGALTSRVPVESDSGSIMWIWVSSSGALNATAYGPGFSQQIASGQAGDVPLGTVTGIAGRFVPSVGIDAFVGRRKSASLSSAYSPLTWNDKVIYVEGSVDVANVLSLVWGRALLDAEIAEVNDNPWQLFAPQKATFFSLPGTSGPVLSAPTVTDITSTSVRPRVTITY